MVRSKSQSFCGLSPRPFACLLAVNQPSSAAPRGPEDVERCPPLLPKQFNLNESLLLWAPRCLYLYNKYILSPLSSTIIQSYQAPRSTVQGPGSARLFILDLVLTCRQGPKRVPQDACNSDVMYAIPICMLRRISDLNCFIQSQPILKKEAL